MTKAIKTTFEIFLIKQTDIFDDFEYSFGQNFSHN